MIAVQIQILVKSKMETLSLKSLLTTLECTSHNTSYDASTIMSSN